MRVFSWKGKHDGELKLPSLLVCLNRDGAAILLRHSLDCFQSKGFMNSSKIVLAKELLFTISRRRSSGRR